MYSGQVAFASRFAPSVASRQYIDTKLEDGVGADIVRVEGDLEQLAVKVGELDDEAQSLRNDVNTIQTDIVSMEASVDALSGLPPRVTALEASSAVASAEIAALQTMLSATNTTVANNQQGSSSAQAALSTATNDNRAEISALKIRMTNTETVSSGLQSSVTLCVSRVDTLESQKASTDVQLSSLDSRVDILETDVYDTDARVSALSVDLAATKVTVANNQQGSANAQAALSAATNNNATQITALKTRMTTEEDKSTAFQSAIDSSVTRIAVLETQNASLASTVADSSSRIGALESGTHPMTASIVGLQSDVSSLSGRVGSLEGSYATLLTSNTSIKETDNTFYGLNVFDKLVSMREGVFFPGPNGSSTVMGYSGFTFQNTSGETIASLVDGGFDAQTVCTVPRSTLAAAFVGSNTLASQITGALAYIDSLWGSLGDGLIVSGGRRTGGYLASPPPGDTEFNSEDGYNYIRGDTRFSHDVRLRNLEITGTATQSNAPSNGIDIANKTYVDSALSAQSSSTTSQVNSAITTANAYTDGKVATLQTTDASLGSRIGSLEQSRTDISTVGLNIRGGILQNGVTDAASALMTHFNFPSDGRNYIRGDTVFTHRLSGTVGIFSSTVSSPASPIDPTHLTPKSYVDSSISAQVTALQGQIDALQANVATLTTALNDRLTTTQTQQLVYTYAWQTALIPCIIFAAGNTFTGNAMLIIASAPILEFTDNDNQIYLMPGYLIELFDSPNYVGLIGSYSVPLHSPPQTFRPTFFVTSPQDRAASCKLWRLVNGTTWTLVPSFFK